MGGDERKRRRPARGMQKEERSWCLIVCPLGLLGWKGCVFELDCLNLTIWCVITAVES